ncbi:MAG TPA: hypothetical protein VF409_04305 [Sphingomonas sp.]
MKITGVMCVAAIAALATAANAQTTPVAPAAPAAPLPAPAASPAAPLPSPDPASPPPRGVAMNTPVVIAVDAPLTSKTSQIGDTFPIRLLEPVISPTGEILIPIGTMGRGEVIHAAKARALGKPGEMILAARYLQCGDTRIPLGHFKFGGRGDDHSGAIVAGMAVAGLVGAPLMFMAGGEMTVPAGTSANAKITANVAMTPEVTANCGGNRVPKE